MFRIRTGIQFCRKVRSSWIGLAITEERIRHKLKALAYKSNKNSITHVPYIILVQLYLYSSFSKGHCHKAASQTSGWRVIFRSLMSKIEVTVSRKNSQRWHEDETLRGSRFKRDPILFWVTQELLIIIIISQVYTITSKGITCVKWIIQSL